MTYTLRKPTVVTGGIATGGRAGQLNPALPMVGSQLAQVMVEVSPEDPIARWSVPAGLFIKSFQWYWPLAEEGYTQITEGVADIRGGTEAVPDAFFDWYALEDWYRWNVQAWTTERTEFVAETRNLDGDLFIALELCGINLEAGVNG